MKFIELKVRTAIVVHGYDADNREIEEAVNETRYVKKLIAIERIQSISEDYVLVTSSHGRMMYWEYEESFSQLKDKLQSNDLLIADAQ